LFLTFLVAMPHWFQTLVLFHLSPLLLFTLHSKAFYASLQTIAHDGTGHDPK